MILGLTLQERGCFSPKNRLRTGKKPCKHVEQAENHGKAHEVIGKKPHRKTHINYPNQPEIHSAIALLPLSGNGAPPKPKQK
jgi:hypothetical protein